MGKDLAEEAKIAVGKAFQDMRGDKHSKEVLLSYKIAESCKVCKQDSAQPSRLECSLCMREMRSEFAR